MATIKDVARQAGVSISTVSRVINHSAPVIEAKYEAVRRAMLTLDYQPNAHAQALVRKYSNTIGLMMGDIASPLCGHVLRGVESVVARENKRLVIGCGQNPSIMDEHQVLERMLLSPCDAFIIQSGQLKDTELVALLRYRPSSVLLGRFLSVFADRCVYPDYFHAGYRASQYLLDLGHKVIGFIGGNEDVASGQLVKEGYRRALKEGGLLFKTTLFQAGFSTAESAYAATRALLEQVPTMTAIISRNDVMAAGILRALFEAGKRIPQDISLIACEETGIADYLSPALTTMRYPVEQMAICAATLALAQVKKEGYTSALVAPEKCCFLPTLMVRDSVIPTVNIY